MSTTQEPNAGHGRTPAAPDSVQVVELQRRPCIATLATRANERALPAIALPHRALHLRRDVARVLAAATFAGTRALAELLLLELGLQAVHREIEQLVHVGARPRM